MSTTVGRERELSVVSDFVAGNSGGVLAIAGEPGIGKTTVWREAIKRARAAGSRVMLARPAEAEAKLSFAGLADLLADVPEELFAGLPEPQRKGIDAALLRRHADRAPARRARASRVRVGAIARARARSCVGRRCRPATKPAMTASRSTRC